MIFTADADGSNDQRIGGVLADKTTCCPGTVATIFPVAPANELCVVRADGSDLTCIIDTEDHKIWTDRTETE